jgi:intracellular multiplication protein IcmV
MRILQGAKKFFKPLVDFPTWMGYRTLVDNGKTIFESTKRMFTPVPTIESTETFKQAMSRLGLTEQDIKKQEKSFLILFIFWLTAAVLLFLYAIQVFMHGGFMGGILGLSLVFLALTLTFRYHFWYYQIKTRTLGLDFQQWLNTWMGVKK